eukprot:TRINITY_DN88171_c0_g1_i1.p1 TRINITY_DN88171_c0_g1~~TRINITY_DN88171_c0_g1_i1.p1  ORF type:complete len:607 (-),score=118.06 TRINITY_DN88171_c0_g1_i1:91-1911(-)
MSLLSQDDDHRPEPSSLGRATLEADETFARQSSGGSLQSIADRAVEWATGRNGNRPRRRASIHGSLQELGQGLSKRISTFTTATTATSAGQSRSLKASFILGEDDILPGNASCKRERRLVWQFLNLIPVEIFFTIVVLTDFAMTCKDTDMRAQGDPLPSWIKIIQMMCLGIYTAEFLAVLFIKRAQALYDTAGRLDMIVLLAGYLEMITEAVNESNTSGLGSARIVRLLRAARMLKLFRRFGKVKELKRLMQMLASCMKTLFWSFLLLFVITTLFALAHVEIIHPIIVQLVAEEKLDEESLHAFGSVMKANLTIFATTIAGDNWSTIAIPVINHSPPVALIFMGASLTIVYGILNLVVAVVVDTFAEQREKDEKMLAQEMEENLQADVVFFKRIFQSIDSDGSGDVSLEELKKGAENQAEFRSRLRVMDIDEADLQHLFEMLDEDMSGSIDPEEFVTTLSRWRHESRTAARFVKYNMQHSLATQESMFKKLEEMENLLNGSGIFEKIERMEKKLDDMRQVPKTVLPFPEDEGSREFESSQKDEEIVFPDGLRSAATSVQGSPVSELLRLMNVLGQKAEVEYMRLVAYKEGSNNAASKNPYEMGFHV